MAGDPTNDTSQVYFAVMQAYQELRNDDIVQNEKPGSTRRSERVRKILAGVAELYAVSIDDLADELARMLRQ